MFGSLLNCEIFLSSCGVENFTLIWRECETIFLSGAGSNGADTTTVGATAGVFFAGCLEGQARAGTALTFGEAVAGTFVSLKFILLLDRAPGEVSLRGCGLSLAHFLLLGARALWRVSNF